MRVWLLDFVCFNKVVTTGWVVIVSFEMNDSLCGVRKRISQLL